MMKRKAWRSRRYREWVRSQPCCMCGAPAEDAHHLIGLGKMGGMGTKAPDWALMPMCRNHHNEVHRDPNLWIDQWEWVSRTLGRAIDEGVFSE